MGNAAKFVLPAIAIAVGAPYLAGLGEGAVALGLEEGFTAAGLTAAGETYGGLTAAGATAVGAAVEGAGTVSAGASLLSGAKSAATIATPIASLLQAASGISASKAMGKTQGPTVPSALTMPTYGGPISFQAQTGSLVAQQQRRGRSATMLTDFGDKLGA